MFYIVFNLHGGNEMKLILIALTMITGCSTISDPYLKVGAGYKFAETKIKHRITQQQYDDPISARIEIGAQCIIKEVTCGINHRSQWFSGAPFNDDKEYGVTEFFIDYTYKFN